MASRLGLARGTLHWLSGVSRYCYFQRAIGVQCRVNRCLTEYSSAATNTRSGSIRNVPRLFPDHPSKDCKSCLVHVARNKTWPRPTQAERPHNPSRRSAPRGPAGLHVPGALDEASVSLWNIRTDTQDKTDTAPSDCLLHAPSTRYYLVGSLAAPGLARPGLMSWLFDGAAGRTWALFRRRLSKFLVDANCHELLHRVLLWRIHPRMARSRSVLSAASLLGTHRTCRFQADAVPPLASQQAPGGVVSL